jgi:CelD/BcsL family acetyltransferase involved in cellulose biosynthesis
VVFRERAGRSFRGAALAVRMGEGLRPSLIVEVVEKLSELLALENDWDALQRTAGKVPFTSFEWSVAWWNQLARRRLLVEDHLAVRTVRNRAGELIAVAPLMLTELPARGPLRFRVLQFFGADPNITELRGVLCRPDSELESYDCLLEHLVERSAEWDFILWGGIPEGAVAERLAAHGRPVWLENVPYFVLDLPPTWESFLATRPRNVKESLRKCRNSLKSANLQPRFLVADQGPALVRSLDELVRLHGARAALTDTVRHANVFAKEDATRFLEDVCKRHAARGRMRVFSLELGGRTVAARLGFIVGDSLYLSYSGYDPDCARYSVMTTVVAEAMKYAIRAGFRAVNLSTGDDVSKTRWSPRRVESKVAMMPSHAARAPLAMTLYNELRRPLAPPSRAAAFPAASRSMAG